MRVLLTGANGFVGSHVLDCLIARGIPTTILIRPTSKTEFIQENLSQVEVCHGSIAESDRLQAALAGVTHVVHCAGLTKARHPDEFDRVNHLGTSNLVSAINRHVERFQRLVHVSSLSVAGPAGPRVAAREDGPCYPISHYGQSKLAGERSVRDECHTEFVVLRPPGVYGPRDTEFLRLFRAISSHVAPVFGGGEQALSLVFVKDLAKVIVEALTHRSMPKRTYYVANPEVVTSAQLTREIETLMKARTIRIALPTAALWPVCLVSEAVARLRRKATLLTRDKYRELSAPAWICDTTRLRQEAGLECPTTLRQGLTETLAWYREQHWL